MKCVFVNLKKNFQIKVNQTYHIIVINSLDYFISKLERTPCQKIF